MTNVNFKDGPKLTHTYTHTRTHARITALVMPGTFIRPLNVSFSKLYSEQLRSEAGIESIRDFMSLLFICKFEENPVNITVLCLGQNLLLYGGLLVTIVTAFFKRSTLKT